ncbi:MULTISPECIES: hypothetical protein [unclassified Cellulophaga]|uniref:hypothetical protein n=1 Tax=unclassified Cellulophaga TaxID=2634405 RepID=UPI0026E378BF|nr:MULTISPECIES: hypothetical protein [unclassified Cellulophaga]MDO6491128.1 hypothetical protein [Cellulophaga sp. 2_MG-2023]MDO6495339.1 hypothetical protein [Cellulophaga sp. 3_MG-2023]
MYDTILNLHSYFAFLVLAILILAVVNAVSGLLAKRDFNLSKDLRVSLFALILSHIQLLIGVILFFVSPNGFGAIKTNGMGGLSSTARLLAVEHPFINIIAIVLITIGWSKHKKVMESAKKFKLIAIFYGLGLLCLLSRIPWGQWF